MELKDFVYSDCVNTLVLALVCEKEKCQVTTETNK